MFVTCNYTWTDRDTEKKNDRQTHREIWKKDDLGYENTLSYYCLYSNIF